MKATMDEQGVITLQAETSVEAFALKRWCSESSVSAENLQLKESHYWRMSRLVVSTEVKGKS